MLGWTSLRFSKCAQFQVNSGLWNGPNEGLWRLMDSYYHLPSFIWANFLSPDLALPIGLFPLHRGFWAKEDLLSFQLLDISTKHDSITAVTSIQLLIPGTWCRSSEQSRRLYVSRLGLDPWFHHWSATWSWTRPVLSKWFTSYICS